MVKGGKMKKTKTFIVFVLLLLLTITLGGCRLFKEYTITGDLHVLENFNFTIKDGKAKVREGEKVIFKANPDKLDKTKILKGFELIKKGKKETTTEKIQADGEAYQVKSDIEFRVLYEDYEYVSLTYHAPEYDGLLSFTEAEDNDPKILAPVIRKNGGVTEFRVGSLIKVTKNENHEIFRYRDIQSISFQEKVFEEGQVHKVTQVPFKVIVKDKDNGKGVELPATSRESLQNLNIGISKVNDKYVYYPGDTIKLDLENVKIDSTKEIDKIVFGSKEYTVTGDMKELGHLFTGDVSELNIQVILKPAKTYKLEFKNWGYYRVYVNGMQTVTDEVYKNDIVMVEFVKPLSRGERLEKVLLNSVNVLKDSDRDAQKFLYQFVIGKKTDVYKITEEIVNLEKKEVSFSEGLYLVHNGNKVTTSPFDVYPYEKFTIEAENSKIPSGKFVKTIKEKDSVLVNGASFVYKVKENSPQKIELTVEYDDLINFYKLNLVNNLENKDLLLVNGGTPQDKYHKEVSKELKFSLTDSDYVFTKILINGSEKKVDSETFTVKYEGSDLSVELQKESIAKKHQEVEIASYSDDVVFENARLGKQKIQVGTKIKIKGKTTGSTKAFLTDKISVNGQMVNFDEETESYEYTVPASATTVEIVVFSTSVVVKTIVKIDTQELTDGDNLLKASVSGKAITLSKDKVTELYLLESDELTFNVVNHYLVSYRQDSAVELDCPTNKLKVPVKFYLNLKFVDKDFRKVKKFTPEEVSLLTSEKFESSKLPFTGEFKYAWKEKYGIELKNKDLYFTEGFPKRTIYAYDDKEIVSFQLTVNLDIDKYYLETQNAGFLETIDKYQIGRLNIFNPIAEINYLVFEDGNITAKSSKDVESFKGFVINYKIVSEGGSVLKEGVDYDVVDGFKLDFTKFNRNIYGKINISFEHKGDKFEIKNCEIVDNAYNVYTQSEVKRYYEDVNTEYMILHRNLLLEYQQYQINPDTPVFTEEFLKDADPGAYDKLKKHIGEPMLARGGGAGSYFKRDLETTQAKDLTVEGNGFKINASNTPHCDFKKGSPYLPSAVADPTAGVFALDGNWRYRTAITNFRNLKFEGNSSLPDLGGAEDESNIPAWASSGIHGIYTYGGHINVYNMQFDNFVIGVYSRKNQASIRKTKIDNCWSSSILFSGITSDVYEHDYDSLKELDYVNHMWVGDSELGKCGGANILYIDHTVGKRGDGYLNRPGSAHAGKTNAEIPESDRYNMQMPSDVSLEEVKRSTPSKEKHSYSLDPTITFKNNKYLNEIDGQSSFYSSMGLGQAKTIISGLIPVFKQLNQNGVIKSHLNNNKKANFVVLFQNPSILEAHTNDDPNQHQHQRHDLRLAGDENGRVYRRHDYRTVNPYTKAIGLSSGGLLIGAGYDVNGFIDALSAVPGVNLNDPNTLQQMYGAALVYSLTGVSPNPMITPLLQAAGEATDLSKNYIELMPQEIAGQPFPATALFKLFDQKVPE